MQRVIDELKDMVNRLALEADTSEAEPAIEVAPHKTYDLPETLICRLPASNPKIRSIIDRFLSQLGEWLARIDEDVEDGDFEQLAKFAYWLKASGGSVGFDAFTGPAKDLEKQAKARDMEESRHTLEVIKALCARINLNAA